MAEGVHAGNCLSDKHWPAGVTRCWQNFITPNPKSTTADTNDIRLELAMLTSRLEAVEQQLAQNGSAPSAPFDLACVMAEVREITAEIFPGKCEFTSEFDPEYPDDRYVVVNVEATGEPKEIVDRCRKWHERIRQSWPDLWDTLRLFVVPR